jgi:hypothetical protein
MPSVSKKQHNLMAAVAHNPKFAKKVGIPQSVGEEFNKADKGKQFKRGGEMAESKKMKMFEKSGKDVEKKGMKEGSKADMALDKKQMMGMKKGGKVKCMASGGFVRSADGIASKGKTKAKQITMAKGGMTKGCK